MAFATKEPERQTGAVADNSSSISTLFLLNSLDIGGSERKIVRLANALSHAGQSVSIAYMNPPETLREDISPRIPVFPLERRGKFSPAALLRLKRITEHHANLTILSVNLYPILYLALLSMTGTRFRWAALLNTTDFRTAKQAALMLIFGPALYLADRYVFGSLQQAKIWQGRYRLSPAKSSCIYNGIDTNSFDPARVGSEAAALRDALRIPAGTTVIGTVGRMRPEKSQHLMLQAAAEIVAEGASLAILFVGDGARRSDLEKMAADLGLSDRTFFLGNLLDVRPALSLMDIFILSSTAVETFSNAALEAMAMGKPLILSDISGAREMVDDGKNGFIVPPGDAGELADRIRVLITDPDATRRMGKISRRRAEDEFSFQTMLDNYRNLIGYELVDCEPERP